MDNPHKPLWSIGELAAATGVTVRALHHYESIGLLRAGVRTAAGHRHTQKRTCGASTASGRCAARGTAGQDRCSGGVPAGSPGARELVRRCDEMGSRFHSREGTKEAPAPCWNETNAELSRALPWTAQQMQPLVAHLQAARQAG